MKFENFKKSLQSKIMPTYFISGEDVFLMYRALSFIEKACVPDYPDLNYVTFSMDSKSTIEDIIDCCNGLPLMDKKRLVVLKGSNLKKNQANAKVLESYLKNPNPDCCFVYFDTTPNDLFNAYKNFFEVIDCNKLSKNLTKQIVIKELNDRNRTISDEALDLLYDNCDGLLSELMQEIKKLVALSNGAIDVKLVEANTEKTLEFQIFELADAIAKRNKEYVLKILNKLMLNKDTREAIIPVLGGQFNRALHSKLNIDTKLVSAELKVKEFAIIKSKELASNFSQKELKNICDLIIKYEHMFKCGEISLENAITCLIADILILIK